MEIFELLFSSAQFCGCLFDVLTFAVDIWAGTSTYRYVKAAKMKTDDDKEAVRMILLVVLIAAAMCLTAFLIVRWIDQFRRA